NDIVLYFARQCEADRHAVGIAPRRADVIAGACGDLVDRNVDRLVELDDHDRAGNADLRLDLVVETKSQTDIAGATVDSDFAFDRIGSKSLPAGMRHKRERKQREYRNRQTGFGHAPNSAREY